GPETARLTRIFALPTPCSGTPVRDSSAGPRDGSRPTRTDGPADHRIRPPPSPGQPSSGELFLPTRGTARVAYGAKDITVLKGLEPVRERPGMYIGSTGLSGLHHLVYEVVDNAVDEAMAGHATRIFVTLLPDGGCRVDDNGRGIPVDNHPDYKNKSAAEVVLTVLHAGGKFGGEGYKISGGLHGVGVSVVNALSSRLDLEIERDGGRFMQRFVDGGEPTGPLERIGDSDGHGTSVTFWPDGSIMEELEFRAQTLVERLREMAFLNKNLEIVFRDERVDPISEQTFKYEGGIIDFVAHLNASKEPLFSSVISFGDTESFGEAEF